VENVTIRDNDGMILTRVIISLTAFDGDEEAIEVTVNDTNITAVYTDSTIELTGNTTHNEYEQVLMTLSYHHSSEQPTGGTRTVSIRGFDGYIYSDEETVSIFFQSLNDAPVLDPNGLDPGFKYSVNFVEDMTDVINVLSNSFTLIDVDNSSLAYIRVILTDTLDADQEFLRVYLSSVNYQNQTLYLSPDLINSSSVESFESILVTIQYVNTAEEPTAGIRNITFIVSDGVNSSTAYTCIQVIARNDRPVLDLNGNDTDGINFTTTFIDSGGPVPITSQNVFITDNDVGSMVTFFSVTLLSMVLQLLSIFHSFFGITIYPR